MGCDPDWLECDCVKGERTFYHSSDCEIEIKSNKEKKDREDSKKIILEVAFMRTLKLILDQESSPVSYTLARKWMRNICKDLIGNEHISVYESDIKSKFLRVGLLYTTSQPREWCVSKDEAKRILKNDV